MPSAIPRRDVSATDPAWQHTCGQRHRPSSECPRRGVWLVASICPTCTPERYCTAHRGHVR